MEPLMDRIEAQLVGTMETFLQEEPAGYAEPPRWFVDCPPANGNQGEKLLHGRNERVVLEYLDAAAALGVFGVTLQVQYPLLDWRFPRRDEYGEFYEWVGNEARARGLAIAAETSPVFSGSYSDIEWPYHEMSLPEYLTRRAIQAAEIADRLRPLYLSVVHEPGTERALTGLPVTDDDLVYLVGITRDLVDWLSEVQVGGGVPILEARESVLAKYAVQCQFLNVHIYPVSAPGMPSAFGRLAELARRVHTPVVCLETWAFKALDVEMMGMAQDPVWRSKRFYDRDPLARWGEQVDPLFLRCLQRLGTTAGVKAVSVFWPQFLWAYYHGKYTDPNLVWAQLNRSLRQNWREGQLTFTGETLQRLLAGEVL